MWQEAPIMSSTTTDGHKLLVILRGKPEKYLHPILNERIHITKKEITCTKNKTRLVGKQCAKTALQYTEFDLFPSPSQKRFPGRKMPGQQNGKCI